jgi:hypothetical protein
MRFPARSIVSITACGGQCGDPECPAVLVTCDCGTCTHLALKANFAAATAEFAVTCDGCTTVTWFEVRLA